MRPSRPVAAVVPALALALALAGCAGTTSDEPDRPAPAPAATGEPADATEALREACLSALPERARLDAVTLEGATDGTISAGVVGPRPADGAVAVLLPQITGMCGWGRYATALQDAGITSVLVDPCGYGASECSDAGDDDPLDEVAPAVRHARDVLGARRVVLVGTSMGGSLTVLAAAAGADVDGWVDVSGPPRWEGTDLSSVADRLPAEGLVVMARSDGASTYRQARALARTSGATFVDGGSGHGWELLTDPVTGRTTRVGARVQAFVTGRPGA